MDNLTGTIIFTTVGRPYYGFDVFSLHLSSTQERRLTDGRSINFNAQFVDNHHTVVYISERSGSAQIFLSRSGVPEPESLPCAPGSLFHDRPVINNGRLFFISAHEKPEYPFRSWSALYVVDVSGKELTRLTPYGCVDYSPAVSRSGKHIAVASNGSRPWGGEFQELNTEIVVFPVSDPEKRTVIAERGGWPSWSGDSVIFFHRQDDDGWWSIYSVDLPENLVLLLSPVRLTPPGVHCFTPASVEGGRRIAIATRRRGRTYRHIEIFDVESRTFQPITEMLNPNLHHYNPFVSPDSESIGYHRFRGGSIQGELTVPHLDPVVSPVDSLRMLRMNGSFPSFSPSGDLIACNLEFQPPQSGVKIVRSDGSRRWTILKNRTAFYNSWSPTEKNVIYTSIGPIFQSAKTTVQIARLTFESSNMDGDDEEIPCDVKILTREETGNNAFCHCSPDGGSLVFRSGRTGHKNLYILDSVNGEFDGGSIRQLTNGPWIETMPSWSPRGDLIAFSSNRHNPDNVNTFSIYLIRPDGSGLRRVYVAGPEGSSEVDRERINHVCFSGDGEWLLFTANLGGVLAEPVSFPNQFQPYGDLYLSRLDGSGLRRLTWNGYENGLPAWYPGDEIDTGRLKSGHGDGDTMGNFEEPLWISCEME